MTTRAPAVLINCTIISDTRPFPNLSWFGPRLILIAASMRPGRKRKAQEPKKNFRECQDDDLIAYLDATTLLSTKSLSCHQHILMTCIIIIPMLYSGCRERGTKDSKRIGRCRNSQLTFVFNPFPCRYYQLWIWMLFSFNPFLFWVGFTCIRRKPTQCQ